MMWFWLFLVLWNVMKCLIFKGFVEVITEVILVIFDLELRVDVWVEHMGGENENSNYYQNVNYAPMQDRDKKYANSTVLRHFENISCISRIFATCY